MIQGRLFIGVEISKAVEDELGRADPKFLNLYLNSGSGAYLCQIQKREKKYIGKALDSVIDLPGAELLQLNILSLFKQLLPTFTISANSVKVFVYLEN